MAEQKENCLTDEKMKIDMEVLKNELEHIKKALDDIKGSLKDTQSYNDRIYLQKSDFRVVKVIVYTGASTILLAVLNEILNIINL